LNTPLATPISSLLLPSQRASKRGVTVLRFALLLLLLSIFNFQDLGNSEAQIHCLTDADTNKAAVFKKFFYGGGETEIPSNPDVFVIFLMFFISHLAS
jgi:hypothetical protein